MLTRFNIWFDSLKEPKRFCVFLLIMLGWLLPASLACVLSTLCVWPSGKSVQPEVMLLTVLAGSWLFTVMIIAISRTIPPKD